MAFADSIARVLSGLRWILRGRTTNGYHLEYFDADGVVTERDISIRKIRIKGDIIYLTAKCATSNDWRTFRADRIMTLINLRTSQRIANPEAYFAGWIRRSRLHRGAIR